MALNDLLTALENLKGVTPDTRCLPSEVSAKAAPILACTRVTPETHPNDDRGRQAQKDGADVEGLSQTRLAVVADACSADSSDDCDALTWHDDDRRCCAHCLNIRPGGICKIAAPGAMVSAQRGYQPDQGRLHRCLGYRPCPDDPDRRPGWQRWAGLIAPVDDAAAPPDAGPC